MVDRLRVTTITCAKGDAPGLCTAARHDFGARSELGACGGVFGHGHAIGPLRGPMAGTGSFTSVDGERVGPSVGVRLARRVSDERSAAPR